MTSSVAENVLFSEISTSIRDGSFPESEDVLTADLHHNAIPGILREVSEERQQLENDGCEASRESASGVDEWIAQAKKLHDDISRSRAIAREIVKEHETGKVLAAAAQDARAKVQLLSQEIDYNTRISNTFEGLQHFNEACHSIQAKLSSKDVYQAAEDWAALQARLETIGSTNAKVIMEEQVSGLHKAALAQVEGQLNELFLFSREGNKIWAQIAENTTMVLKRTGEVDIDVNIVLAAAEQLQATESIVKSISRDIERVLLHPVLFKVANPKGLTLQVQGKRLEISEASSLKGVTNVIEGVTTVLDYLHSHLPNRLKSTIAKTIVPDTISTLITEWLTESVPVELSEIPIFEELQTRVLRLSELLKRYGWSGSQDLIDWIERAPRMWLTKRRMASLDGVRKALAAERGTSRKVERVERQVVSKKEAAFAAADTDDWNNEWDDEDEKQDKSLNKVGGEEDGNGWGFDEDESEETDVPIRSKTEDTDKEDDSAEAWGWDEDGPAGLPTESSLSRNKGGAGGSGPVNGTNGSSDGGRELTLKEEYTITDVPDLVLEIINKDIREALEVTDARYGILHGINPTNGLLALPTFVVAMFRATAPSYYGSMLSNGNMRLYNDCLYISERLRDVAATPQLVKRSQDCDSLEKFGKSAYSKEMDVQRTVLGDLLDGAQGFTSCTQFPYSTQCEEATSSVVDRLKELYAQWKPILSHSALLQSIGSLLSRVIDKIVDDIEDMEDITEPESQRLTSFCNQVSALSDLFVPEKAGAEPDGASEAVPLTAVYVTTWLRFQYLINILDSSLIDIKYLWTDGELSLEFTAEEVVDLIRALFAESPNRRETISQIRRSILSEETTTEFIQAPIALRQAFAMASSQGAQPVSAQAQVRLQLSTRDEQIRVPDLAPILVPTSLRRYALSTLVNNFLNNDKPLPLEFLVNGQYLRTSIDEFLTSNGISAETTLSVEYVRALIPPLHVASFEHDDWVGAVDVLSTERHGISHGYERILSGGFDGILRIWNPSAQVLATSPSPSQGGHSMHIQDAKFLSSERVVSAGFDGTVRIWNYTETEKGFAGKLRPDLELYCHRGDVKKIAVDISSNRILSASADHCVGFWSTKKSEGTEAPASLLPSAVPGAKKRKLNPAVQVPQRGPLAIMKQHTQQVTGVAFDSNDTTVGYSTSWDHTLRTWDLVTSAPVDTRTTSHALSSLEQLPQLHLLACGTTGRHITMIDPRTSAATISAMTLRGHTNAVVSLAKDPDSDFGLVSGSYDGTCRIWDVRRSKQGKDGVVGESIYSIERESAKGQKRSAAGEGIKVFSVCWDKSIGILSASEDKRIQINRGEGVVSKRNPAVAA